MTTPCLYNTEHVENLQQTNVVTTWYTVRNEYLSIDGVCVCVCIYLTPRGVCFYLWRETTGLR